GHEPGLFRSRHSALPLTFPVVSSLRANDKSENWITQRGTSSRSIPVEIQRAGHLSRTLPVIARVGAAAGRAATGVAVVVDAEDAVLFTTLHRLTEFG